MKTFSRDGVSFAYPANWSLELDDADTGWTASIQSQEMAFGVVSLRPDAESAGQVASEVLAALRVDYAGLDVEDVTATIASSPAVGHDVIFLSLDAVVTCRIRVADTTAGPLLVFTQVSEFDAARHGPALAALVASIQVEDDNNDLN